MLSGFDAGHTGALIFDGNGHIAGWKHLGVLLKEVT
jgi:hypothetical protein